THIHTETVQVDHRHPSCLPKGARLSCSALKQDPFHNVRAPWSTLEDGSLCSGLRVRCAHLTLLRGWRYEPLCRGVCRSEIRVTTPWQKPGSFMEQMLAPACPEWATRS